MFYTKEQVEAIEKIRKEIHSGRKNKEILCQFRGRSCVRCCLPHIGGDSHTELTEDEATREFNKDNHKFELRYSDRYVGPSGLIMKFANYHPLQSPKFEISHFENSFKDVGKKEMERRFRRRFKLFKEEFNPSNPVQTLKEFWKKIKSAENYTYESSAALGLCNLFFGGSAYFKKGEKLPECQMLAFLDREEKCVGCLVHPKSTFMNGLDGRKDAGFFANTPSCNVNCAWKEEFQHLGKNAIELFDKFTKGMSWYQYSRHSTAVFVSYLRVYEPIINRIAEKDKLEKLTLEKLVEFTNNIFENVPYKEPICFYKINEEDIRIPHYPRKDILLEEDKFWIDREEIPYKLYSRNYGYSFVIGLNGDKKEFQVHVKDRKPEIKNLPEELSRASKYDIIHPIRGLFYGRTSAFAKKILDIKERIMLKGLNVCILKDYWEQQSKEILDYVYSRTDDFCKNIDR